MKTLLIFLLTLSGASVLAQPVVLSQGQAAKKGVKFGKLLAEYDPARMAGQPVTWVPYSLKIYIDSSYNQILDTGQLKDVSVWTDIFFGVDGKIDYFFFSVSEAEGDRHQMVGHRVDSLSAIISEKLPPILAKYRLKWSQGEKSSFPWGSRLGVKRTKPDKPAKDSTINNLDDALAVVDTLKVKYLMLGQSLLTRVPDVIYRFPNLEVLNFTDNDIESANIDMRRLPRLRQLDLGRNVLTQDAIHISKNKSLKLLFLQTNLITDIPKTVRNCKGIKTLWLGYNKLSGLNDDSFRKMRRLTDLNLYKVGITVLPKAIGKVKRLEVLDLYYNELTVVPASLSRLRRLTHLAVSYNKIQALPPKIDKMKSVHTIYAHHNHLSKLPDRIGRMKKVKILDLGYNWFSDFPAAITALPKFQELDLSSNNFHQFPVKLLEMKGIEKVFLRGNPFLKEGTVEKYKGQLTALKSKNTEVFD